jgi:hypothetical protein
MTLFQEGNTVSNNELIFPVALKINGIIRNNKCIFTKLNAVFILKTAAWKKKYYNS